MAVLPEKDSAVLVEERIAHRNFLVYILIRWIRWGLVVVVLSLRDTRMGGFGYFLKSTLFSGRHPEIIPLVSAIALCGVCAVFVSIDNLFYNPTVVALKSEREAYSRNERQRDYEDRPFLKLVKPLRDRPISFISPNDENSRIPH